MTALHPAVGESTSQSVVGRGSGDLPNRPNRDVSDTNHSVARRLHDETLGIAFAARLHLQSAASSGTVNETMQVVLDRVEAIMVSLRDAIVELNCGTPDETTQSLMDLVADLNRSLPMKIDCRVGGDPAVLDRKVMSALLSITREALTNVARHSRAENAAIEFVVSVGHVDLTIDDDGQGFDVDAVELGCGLQNIGVRAASFRGTARIETSSTGGARVRVRLPRR